MPAVEEGVYGAVDKAAAGDAVRVVAGARPRSPKAEQSLPRIVGITAFNLPYGTICATMGMVILPKEAAALFPSNPALALGGFLAIVGVTQLVCPYAGVVSDRGTSPLGKRRPYMLAGLAASVPLYAAMWAASSWRWPLAYSAALFLNMVALNVVFAAQVALIADIVPKRDHGSASGATGLHMLSGAVLGFVIVALTSHWEFRLCYPFYAAQLAAFTLLSCCCAQEPVPERADSAPLSWAELRDAYTVNTSKEGPGKYDFMWIFVGRTSFYVGVSAVAYCQYYLHDMIGVRNDSTLRRQMAVIVILAQGTAAIASWPCGKLSDSLGRKPLVYISVSFMCVSYFGYMAAMSLAPPGEGMHWVYVSSFLYGCGNGCYLSVDLALANDCLPDPDNPAKDLGVWGVAAFVGSAIGPLLWGTSYSLMGQQADGDYTMPGYTVMFSVGCLFAAGAGIFIKFVKDAK